jgi:hypothetical protein
VGSVNTAQVHSIDVTLTVIKQAGNDKLSEALTALAEAIANSREITAPEKEDMLDQVSFLSDQAAGAAQARKPGMIKAAMQALTVSTSTVNAVTNAWTAAKALLKATFGIES